MLNRFRRILAIAVIATLPFAAQAQGYPNKPLRLINAFPPGAPIDLFSRAIAHELSKLLGQPVVVENRSGAGGNIGGEAAARSAPDGYTLFMTTNAIHAINPVLYPKMSYDPNKDFAPVASLASLINVLVLHPSVKANSVQELIELAKASPGKLTFASAGSGTTIHLSGEMFKQMAGVDMLHIPYKGAAPAVTDLLSGQVSMMFTNIPSVLPHIKAGALRALATTGAKRAPALPDLPTIAEVGLPGYESTLWLGLVVPTGTPRDIIQRLNAESIKGVNLPEFRERMIAAGFELIPGSPERMAEMLKADIAKWAPVVKASGAKVD